MFLAFLTLDCATRHQTRSPVISTSAEAGAANAQQDPGPLVSSQPVPTPPTDTTQASSTFGFAQVDFQDINGFDAPFFTISVPQDSALKWNNFKVQYKACPINPDPQLPKNLQSCISGYQRDLQFMLPIFTQEFSVELQLCNGDECQDSANSNLTMDPQNQRFLTSQSDPDRLQLASFLVDLETDQQAVYTVDHKIFVKLPELMKFIQSCKHSLTTAQIQQLTVLSNASPRQLEGELSSIPLSDLQGYLSQDFLAAQNQELKGNSLQDSIMNNFDTGVAVIVGVFTTAYVIKDIWAGIQWTNILHKSRTITDKDGKVLDKFIKDSVTGFLIKDSDMPCSKKACNYYIQDPFSGKIAKDADGHYLRIDPYNVNPNAKGEEPKGVRMVGESFYAYNYEKKTYTIQSKTGERKAVASNINVGEMLRTTFEPNREYRLYDFKRDDKGNYVSKNPVELSNDSLHTAEKLESKEGMTAFSEKQRKKVKPHANYHKKFSIKDYPEFVHDVARSGNTRYFLATGLSIGSWVFVGTGSGNSTPAAAAALAAGTESKAQDICSKGVSLQKEMTQLAEIRTQMQVINLKIASFMPVTVQTFPLSKLSGAQQSPSP